MLKDHICRNIAFSFVLVADVALVEASWLVRDVCDRDEPRATNATNAFSDGLF